MAVVDFENAWYALKARLGEKRSWGTGQIAEVMAELEVHHRLSEDQQGFDDRPVRQVAPSTPTDDEPELDLHEPAQIATSG
jgi:hypothetical protein